MWDVLRRAGQPTLVSIRKLKSNKKGFYSTYASTLPDHFYAGDQLEMQKTLRKVRKSNSNYWESPLGLLFSLLVVFKYCISFTLTNQFLCRLSRQTSTPILRSGNPLKNFHPMLYLRNWVTMDFWALTNQQVRSQV